MKKSINKTIAVTRSKDSVADAFDELTELGAEIIYIPTITTIPLDDYSQFDKVTTEISSFDYLLFTSANAVKFFTERLLQLKITVNYSKFIVACVGDKTADCCIEHGIHVNIIPESHNASSLCREFDEDMDGKKFLIPCSNIARDELKTELEKLGCKVCSVPVYKTELPSDAELRIINDIFTAKKVDLIAFTSPSSFSNFITALNIKEPTAFFKSITLGAIGHTTETAIKNAGLNVDIVPDSASLNKLAHAITEFYSKPL